MSTIPTNEPYKRSHWNGLVAEVNAVLTDPPDGCDPVDPLDELPENTIWAKSHIEDMRAAIAQTCPDIVFSEPLELWNANVLHEIEAALDQAWCDCEETCCQPCEPSEETEFLTSISMTGVCGPIEDNCGSRTAFEAAVTAYTSAKSDYLTSFCDYVYWQGEVDRLQDELDALQAELDALIDAGAPPDEIAAKQAEVNDKQDLLDNATSERDSAQSETSTNRSTMLSSAAATMSEAIAIAINGHTSAATLLTNGPGWPYGEIETMRPACCGCAPDDCITTFALQVRNAYNGFPPGSYSTVISGHYTLDGSPAILSMFSPCYTLLRYNCSSTDCGTTGCPTASQTQDWRIIRTTTGSDEGYTCETGDPC